MWQRRTSEQTMWRKTKLSSITSNLFEIINQLLENAKWDENENENEKGGKWKWAKGKLEMYRFILFCNW